jgi:hypothetical protein
MRVATFFLMGWENKSQLKMSSASCYVIADIRGDYELLLHLFVHEARLIRMTHGTDGNSYWEWLAKPETCVILLGNYINCFENPKRRLTVHEAIHRETNIIDFIIRMEDLAERNQCKVIALMGQQEVGTLVDDVNILLKGLKDANDVTQRNMRKTFVQTILIPFATTRSVIAQWGDYVFVNQGFELAWFRAMNFSTIRELNERWRLWVTSGQKSQLTQWFWRPDSIVQSVKMAEHPTLWRDHDQPNLDILLGAATFPHYVVAGPPPLSRKPLVESPIVFLNNEMSDTFSGLTQALRPPQVLILTATFTSNGVLAYQECSQHKHEWSPTTDAAN